MPDKLKPCPFCNGKVTHYHTNHLNLNHQLFDFRCEKCGAYFTLPNNEKYVSAEKTESKAIELFNRRVENAK